MHIYNTTFSQEINMADDGRIKIDTKIETDGIDDGLNKIS